MLALENGARRRHLAKAVVEGPSAGGQERPDASGSKRGRGEVTATPSTQVTPDGKIFKEDNSEVCPRKLSFSSCGEGRFSSMV